MSDNKCLHDAVSIFTKICVVCPSGAEKLLMIYIKECWADVNFSVNALFVDTKTFQVSCQEISPECTKHFHELLLWVIT